MDLSFPNYNSWGHRGSRPGTTSSLSPAEGLIMVWTQQEVQAWVTRAFHSCEKSALKVRLNYRPGSGP
jgi:hypothetical protein